MYYTYILKSLKNGRFYTGSCAHVQFRLEEHNRGKSSYDKANCPFELYIVNNLSLALLLSKENVISKRAKADKKFNS